MNSIKTMGLVVTLMFLFSGCTSVCHKKRAADVVVDKQRQLLLALKEDRETVSKQPKGSALTKAEVRLNQSLEALLKSTDAMKEVMK